MGILQGDSPTPAPTMYWQPYQDSAMLRTSLESNNNNNNEEETKLTTLMDISQDLIKQEREEALLESKKEENSHSGVICAGCGYKIADRYYLVAVDKAWHSECLRCDECRQTLDAAHSCFARQSRIYCRDDYQRLFGGRKECAKCGEGLRPDELVMRGREHLYHTRCFSCHVCHTHLIKGSTFGMVGPLIFCHQHYRPDYQPQQPMEEQPFYQHHHQQHQPYAQQPHEAYGSPLHQHHHISNHHYDPFQGAVPTYDHHLMSQQPHQVPVVDPVVGMMDTNVANKLYKTQQRVRTKRRSSSNNNNNNVAKAEIVNVNEEEYMGEGLLDTSSSLGSGNGGQQQKTKRLRTSFKHHQLRMLKSYFATNHNPDAKDLKQLSQKTTLSKRVLQVWFQNARAKWRRLVQKQEGGNGNGQSGSGGSGSSAANRSGSCSSSGSGNEMGSPVPSSSSLTMNMFHQHPHSRMSLYDDMSLSSSSVASVGFPSPL